MPSVPDIESCIHQIAAFIKSCAPEQIRYAAESCKAHVRIYKVCIEWLVKYTLYSAPRICSYPGLRKSNARNSNLAFDCVENSETRRNEISSIS